MKNFTDALVEDYSVENYYFVICMIDGELFSAGTIKATNADEAVDNYWDETDIAYGDEEEDMWDDWEIMDTLERYALKISKEDYDNNTYNLTDTASALAFISEHEDEFEELM